MDQPFRETYTKKQKIYFVYFLVFTCLVIIIFAFIIIGTFWNYGAKIRDMGNYYKNLALKARQVVPQINSFDPILGTAEAKVTIYEFTDFLCPACKDLQTDLTSLEKFYGNKIRVVFKGLAITIHPQTRPALEAAYCAAEQNAFWQYKDLLFQEPNILNELKFREYASLLNLNLDSFNQCLTDKKYESLINQNISQAVSLQITSVPTLYINSQKVEGFLNYETIKKLIDQELSQP